jgi:DNA-directed RNA polymerase specialized sigma24 family protein
LIEILRSARSDPGGQELQEVLACFRRRFRAYAAKRWPWLAEHWDDAINMALARVCDRIDEIEDADVDRVEYWVNLQFIRVMDGIRKAFKKEKQRRADLSDPDHEDESNPWDRFPNDGPDSQEQASARERLRIVQSVLRLSREAWLRLVEDLPVDEVARLTGRSPEWIRTFTMRLRRALREYLDENPAEGAFGKSGLPKDFVAKVLELLRNMRN